MATSAAIPDLDRLRPAGTKRSSKRDLIVNVFLKQEGHLSADDLVDSDQARRSPHQPRDRLPHAAVDGGGGHRPQSGFRRRPVPLRAFLSPSAALSPDLQDLQSLVRVPQLRHRGARRRSRGGARLHRAAERRADLRHLRSRAAPAGRPTKSRPTPNCCSRATRCASRSPPSAAAWSSTGAASSW